MGVGSAKRRKAMLRNFKVVLIVLVILAIAGSAYAFAAANTFTGDNYVGSGESTVSGYEVSAIQYNFMDGDPTLVESVQFTLNHPARSVKIQLNDTAVTGDTTWSWTSCSNTANNDWTCTGDPDPMPTTDITTLNVAASS